MSFFSSWKKFIKPIAYVAVGVGTTVGFINPEIGHMLNTATEMVDSSVNQANIDKEAPLPDERIVAIDQVIHDAIQKATTVPLTCEERIEAAVNQTLIDYNCSKHLEPIHVKVNL
jgi:hypothetical protein